ncbi:hypothetical protein ABKA04_006803 [Annulohypoxylon sp. FPYF3050]
MNSLEIIFGELGISHYLEAFVDQGFDSWETILDITESDLDALGVKLGHRRKLQRRIANYRGVAPETSLVSPTRTSIEDAKLDSNRIEPLKPEKPDGTAVAKRKYRRHPKPDDNAPERPPSAYVLFSNKMREDLKGQNLTFTEIAKLVGENWQNLSREEKDPFERQAHEAKEKYNQKDVSKRLKTEADSVRGSSTSGSAGASGTNSGTVSGSDSQPGSEPPPSRQQRMGSSASTIESSFSPGLNGIHHGDDLHSPRTLSYDEPGNGRPRGLSSPTSRDLSIHATRRPGWADGQRVFAESTNAASWFDPRSIHGTLRIRSRIKIFCVDIRISAAVVENRAVFEWKCQLAQFLRRPEDTERCVITNTCSFDKAGDVLCSMPTPSPTNAVTDISTTFWPPSW